MARIAVVTGGAGGIGAAIALQLARDGIDVAVLDRDEDACALVAAQVTALGRRAIAAVVNTADADSVHGAFARVGCTLGTPTVLLNNVGAVPDRTVSDMSGSDWDECIGDHLRAAFVLSRAALDPMIKMGGGRIITVVGSAGPGHQGRAENLTVHAGLTGFTRTLALELEPVDITVNLIVAWPSADGRSTAPTDFALTASFLVSDGAAAMTGQTVQVTGSSRQPAPVSEAATRAAQNRA
jgi:3-oxoacyl-[acyl-carrier protein] reductase